MLTLTEAAARLGVAASTLRGQIANGKLRGRLVGKTWTVSEREVERYREASLGRPGRRPKD
jgi:excisionase family DNA binding protein